MKRIFRGFTLIELLVSLAILALLATAAVATESIVAPNSASGPDSDTLMPIVTGSFSSPPPQAAAPNIVAMQTNE